jgi:inhibitor of cysteine peptidase
MLTIDETYDNGVARARVGDPIRLQLSENPTTGYRWQMQPDVTAGLRILADSFEASVAGAGAGAGGVRFWTIVADEPGKAVLRLELKRSWEKTSTRTFSVTIEAEAG